MTKLCADLTMRPAEYKCLDGRTVRWELLDARTPGDYRLEATIAGDTLLDGFRLYSARFNRPATDVRVWRAAMTVALRRMFLGQQVDGLSRGQGRSYVLAGVL